MEYISLYPINIRYILNITQYAFVKQLTLDPANTVVGIVRDIAATEKKLAKDGIKNVKVYKADITDLPALKAAAVDIQASIGGIDYLIVNAAFVSGVTSLRNLSDLFDSPFSFETIFSY